MGIPPRTPPSADYSVIHGLRAAIEALCECSDIQHEKRTSLTENASKVLNRCRVICITSTRDNNSIKSLEEIFQNVLLQQNKIAAGSDQYVRTLFTYLVSTLKRKVQKFGYNENWNKKRINQILTMRSPERMQVL